MDFTWTKDQLAHQARVIEFARSELADDLVRRDRDSVFERALWQRCADFGIQAMALPKQYSGRDEVDFLTAILAMEGMGYGCRDNGLNFALNAHMWTVALPILQFGSDEQKDRFLPGMADGSLIGAHAITEPGTGSDVFSMSAHARPVPGGYRLTAHKHYVSLAPVADVALVMAMTDPDAGRWGISAFLVERDREGASFGSNQEKMGLRTVPFGEIRFEDCFVPEANRIGPEGAGVSLSNAFLEWERCAILASQLGAMQRQLEACVAYARERKQFGEPIGHFQAVSHRIANMRLRLETSRLLLYKVAWLKQTGQSAMTEAALLKLHLSESFTESSIDAIRIHGGRGYISEFGIERDLRDALGSTIYAGTSDIQRNIIARLLGL